MFITAVSPCLDQPVPASEWIPERDFEQMQVTAADDDNVLVLVSYDSMFTCPGSVSQWTLRWYHRAVTDECARVRFTFLVYKKQPEGCINLIIKGHNSFRVENTRPELQEIESVFYVEPNRRIDVEEGDFISVRVELNSLCAMNESSVWVAGRAVVGVELYHTVFSNVFEAILLTFVTPCSQLQQSNILPFLSAVVGESINS